MSHVEWEAAAREEFYAIWEVAKEAELPALERAVQGVLADLSSDPLAVGESRGEPSRVVICEPLTVWYEVRDDGRQVRIVRVRRPVQRG